MSELPTVSHRGRAVKRCSKISRWNYPKLQSWYWKAGPTFFVRWHSLGRSVATESLSAAAFLTGSVVTSGLQHSGTSSRTSAFTTSPKSGWHHC